MNPLRVVGIELELQRGERGRRAGDGDSGLGLIGGVVGDGRLDQRADVGGERLHLPGARRVGGHVPLGLPDYSGLQ